MPLGDSAAVRAVLAHLFPGINIERNVQPSGQRLVYFCRFAESTDVDSQKLWADWGDVVLKISEGIHPTVIARIEKEWEILRTLSSFYFPKPLYFDVFSADPVTEALIDPRWFITIEERIPGGPLCEETCRFESVDAVVQLLDSLCCGLELLWTHPKRIVHRDLKPQNILIRPDGSPVVIDLGIIREQGSPGVTGTLWPHGPCTPGYASPEQLLNDKLLITFKADFFALGVIAYELLAGKNPFRNSPSDHVHDVMDRTHTLDPPTLESLGKAPRTVSDLVTRLMAKQPFLRPRTVTALQQELRQLAANKS